MRLSDYRLLCTDSKWVGYYLCDYRFMSAIIVSLLRDRMQSLAKAERRIGADDCGRMAYGSLGWSGRWRIGQGQGTGQRPYQIRIAEGCIQVGVWSGVWTDDRTGRRLPVNLFKDTEGKQVR